MKNLINKIFPSFDKREVKLFYIYTIFSSGWFILSNWVFFYSKFLSIEQIGIIDGIAVLIGIITVIPTGAIADLIGKKKTLSLAHIFHIVGIIMVVAGDNFVIFIIAQSILNIGDAFRSGAKEALVYDTAKELNIESSFSKIQARISSITLFTTVFATFTGGLLYAFNIKFPWIAWLLFEVIAILLLRIIKEPKIDSYKFSIKNYFKQNTEGFLHIFNGKMHQIIIYLIPMILVINIVSGIVRQSIAADFGFSGDSFGYLLSFSFLVTALIMFKLSHLKDKLGEIGYIFVTMLIFFIGFSISFIVNDKNIFVGGFIILLFSIGQIVADYGTLIIVNSRIDSKYRATSLSSLAFLNKIPYIIIVLFFASSLEKQNINSFYLYFSIIMGISLLLIILKKLLSNKSIKT